MLQIASYYPISITPIKFFLNQQKRNILIINSSSNCLTYAAHLARKVMINVAIAASVVVMPILFLIDTTIHILRKLHWAHIKTHFSDYHYFFNSKLFTMHLQQMRSVTQQLSQRLPLLYQENSVIANRTQTFIQFILAKRDLSTDAEKRRFHELVTLELRDLVRLKKSLSNQTSETVKFIEAFCEWLYIGQDLVDEMGAFVQEHIPSDISEIDQPTPSHQLIKKWHIYLDTLIKFNGLSESDRLYDPRYLGDVPSRLFTHGSTIFIRTPTITRDVCRQKGKTTSVTIVEEFLGFLDSYKKQGKKHLYINLMQRQGSEGVRSRAIEQLEKEYPDTLHVITLTKDFSFYWQNEKFLKISETETFKKSFIELLFKPDGHFYWSPHLRSPSFKESCREILDKAHRELFKNKAYLSVEERRNFIEIAYTSIVDALIARLNPDSCNISCKSCIDRGPAFLAEQFYQINKKGTELPIDMKKRLLAIALAPALLAQNRVMQHDRLNRLFSALQTLQN